VEGPALTNGKWQFITNLYQWDACGRGFSDLIVPLPMFVVASRRLSFSISSMVWFLFPDLTCFVVEKCTLTRVVWFPTSSAFLRDIFQFGKYIFTH